MEYSSEVQHKLYSSRSDPSFCETEKIRVIGIDKIT